MAEFLKNLWRQFGFWHWILAPLAAAELVVASLYKFSLTRNFSPVLVYDLWFAANCGIILFLAVLAISIALRFKAYTSDDSFGLEIYRRMNKIWFASIGFVILGFGTWAIAATLLKDSPFSIIFIFIGVLLIFAFIGIFREFFRLA